MRVIRAPLTRYAHGDEFRLYGLGDLHLGCPTVDEKALRALVRRIADDPHAHWIGMGDYGDLIDARDKRFGFLPIDQRYWDAQTAPGGIPAETTAHVVEVLEPIRDRCLGLLEGNHETSVYARTNYSLLTAMAEALRLQHLILGYEGFVVWPFARKHDGASKANGAGAFAVTIQAAHGAAAPRRSGSLYNNAEVLKSRYPSADIIFRGHGHQKVGAVYDAVVPGHRHVRPRPWAYCMTGTFKRGRYEDKPGDAPTSTYEARKDFFPTTQLGPPEVIITPRVNNGKEMNLPPFDLTVRV